MERTPTWTNKSAESTSVKLKISRRISSGSRLSVVIFRQVDDAKRLLMECLKAVARLLLPVHLLKKSVLASSPAADNLR